MMSFDEASTRLMLNAYKGLLRPILFTQDAERIHDFIIHALGILPEPILDLAATVIGTPTQSVEVAGVTFPGRVGFGAGLDKNGDAVEAWSSLGFGFMELGTVTARAQPGNPKPRSFRLIRSQGLINRMGFNNAGAEALSAQLIQRGQLRGNNALGCPVGISIGKTKVTPLDQALPDYLFSLEALEPHADYLAVNVSSPNTPDLRKLQGRDVLAELTAALVHRAEELTPTNPVPVFLKVAPDLSLGQLEEVIEVCEAAGIAGLIATNTTVGRELIHPADLQIAEQVGGLSGSPLRAKSLEMVKNITSRTDLPVMGVGGIMSPSDAQAMFDAGAVLVQVFTGFIFNGPALVRGINKLTQPRVF